MVRRDFERITLIGATFRDACRVGFACLSRFPVKMKTIKSGERVNIPPGVEVKAIRRVVYVKGPRGTLKRDFKHLAVDIKVTPKRLTVTKFFGDRKELAAVRTVCSHIENMIKGVTQGFCYKLKSVYAHFPINMVVSGDGSKLEIRNFLGEKSNKFVGLVNGVKVSQTGVKDEIQLEGNDIEQVAKCAAQIHQSCKVRNKDIRKFLDGIYVASKGVIE
ncbi:Ribosomal protein rpl9 [Paragonimus heterotremus]|uniref:Large ribosomal subunit protein uL6 n=1 Tax=Paragonimus heterotremus TaxID=100268 RepID=A0A8J4STI1_9TREM|nr:Ribosomal protein rpl9 [Paragonimus heterotremus]